jgi:hypothetical protein
MLSFTPEAAAYIRQKGGSLYLVFRTVWACCTPYDPRLSIMLGKPSQRDRERYREEKIDGFTVYIPRELPDYPMVAHLNTSMGFKRLALEGDIPGVYTH